MSDHDYRAGERTEHLEELMEGSDLQETGLKRVDWIDVAEDWDK
jgi:hypothetical protein